MLRSPLEDKSAPTIQHFYQLIERYAEDSNTRDRIAIFQNDAHKITYRELNKRANQLANYLVASNYGRAETRIGLFFHLSVDYYVCLLAIMKAGLSFVALSPSTTQTSRLKMYATQSEIEILLVSEELKNHPLVNFFQVKHIVLKTLNDSLLSSPDTNPQTLVKLEQLAYIHNTSGSTSTPKQVLINHAGLLNCATDLITRLAITEKDKIAAYADISFDAHLAEMMMTLGAGAALYIIPLETRVNFVALARYYNAHSITVTTWVPSVLRYLAPESFPTLRVLLSTGEAAVIPHIEAWCNYNKNLLFVNGYGPSEVSIATSIAVLKPGDPIHIGTAIKGLNIYVLETEPKNISAPQWVQPDEKGEMYISGAGVGRGYTNKRLSDERFRMIDDPDHPAKKIRVYQTRDVAKYEITADKSYRFYALGRLDKQVKVKGMLIALEEHEALLVNDLVVHAQVNPQMNSVIPDFIAYLQVKPGFDLYEYQRSVAKLLPGGVAPSRWVIVDEPLFNASGKNDLKSSNKPSVRAQSHSSLAPSTGLEIELAEIFRENLKISEPFNFTVDDDYYMLGGESLQLANLLTVLRARFQLKLSSDEFKRHASIAALARCINRLNNENEKLNQPTLLSKPSNSTLTPVFLLHALLGNAEQDYEKLSKQWPNERPLYGITSRTFKNTSDMDIDLEAIASDYIASIKSIQPHGPYILTGWSAGGLIAYAICQQLSEQKETAFLHMIDSEALSIYRAKNRAEYAEYLFDLFEHKLKSFLDIATASIDKQTLASLPKTRQIYVFFQNLLAAVTSNDAALLQMRKGHIATIRNTLLAILHYTEANKIEQARLWAATMTQTKHRDKQLGWLESQISFADVTALDGDHESIILEPNSAKLLATKLEDAIFKQLKAFELKEIIQQLKLKQLAYVAGTQDNDLYTPLEGCYDLAEPNYQRFNLLSDIVMPFINDPNKTTLLILAEAGSGKTKFSEYLTEYLWLSAAAKSELIPIYIRLSNPNIKNAKERLLEDTLKAYGLNDDQIITLLNDGCQHFCFIFDGVDELIRKDTSYQNFYFTNHIHQRFPNSHCVFTSRLGAFVSANFEELFKPMDKYGKSLPDNRCAKTISITPFDDKTKRLYISKYIRLRPMIGEGFTNVETIIKRLKSIPALYDIIGHPIFIMMTMNVLHFMEAFYKIHHEHLVTEVIQKDLFHMYTHHMYARASDKKKEQGIISVGKLSVYSILLEFSISLAQAMQESGLMEISEEALFSDNPFGDITIISNKLDKFKKFFCTVYDTTIYKREEHFHMFKIGREGCDLLRARGTPGNYTHAFLHDEFRSYFANLLPQVITHGRRKEIQEFIDNYILKLALSEQPSITSHSLFKPEEIKQVESIAPTPALQK